LRHRSKHSKTITFKTPRAIKEKVLAVRKATGFGPKSVLDIVNESLNMKTDRNTFIPPDIQHLGQEGEIERERRIQKEWKRFEWSHPNRLILANLTDFYGVAILSMGYYRSRRGWATSLQDRKDKIVVKGKNELVRVICYYLLIK
jgi:hypothetical protein